MKILLLSHSSLTSGGAEKCLVEYIDVLIANGHTCRVIVPADGDLKNTLEKRGIYCDVVGYGWALKPYKEVDTDSVQTNTGNSLIRIFERVKAFSPDVIITNTAVIPWGLYVGKALGIPNILLVHEVLSEKDPSLEVLPSYEKYMRILNQNTDYVIYNSKFVRNEYKAHLTSPVEAKNILYPLPPLDTQKIDAAYKENIFNDSLKIAIFGALAPRKNQQEALNAARILKERGITNFKIDMYGDVAANIPYVKILKAYINEHNLADIVQIRGYTNNVYETINEYNAVLSTSTFEPFGRTLIEAQLFGRLVISNNTGGGLELVDDMETGLIYTSGNAEELADRIEWIINHNEEGRRIGLRAKSVQTKKYIVDSRYAPLLDSVAYFAKYKGDISSNLFDPIVSLIAYNEHITRRYEKIAKVVDNRITRKVKSEFTKTKNKSKRIIKEILSMR